MQKAKDAWSRAGKAIENTESNLAKIEQAQKDIEDTALVTFSWDMGDGRNDFYIGTKAAPNKYHWFGATATHGHELTPTFTNGILKLHIRNSSSTNSAVNTELADLSDAVKDLSGDSTTGKLSWSTYGGGSGNFNIADTDYFKEAVAAAQEEGYKAAVDRCSIDTTTNKVSIAAGTFAEQSTTTKTASASASAAAYDGSSTYTPYRRYDGTNVPATGTYTNSAGSSTGSFGYTGSYYKTELLTIKTSASVSWS